MEESNENYFAILVWLLFISNVNFFASNQITVPVLTQEVSSSEHNRDLGNQI